ncbi:MAG: hypothetical protein QGI64_07835, partial [Desulfobacterales bacterium]|nr:hypothetical protein [Desulfobacterales bacterium]
MIITCKNRLNTKRENTPLSPTLIKVSLPAQKVNNIDSLVKIEIRWQSKKLQIQGTQILRNKAYLQYAAMVKDAAQHISWAFYEAVNINLSKNGNQELHT